MRGRLCKSLLSKILRGLRDLQRLAERELEKDKIAQVEKDREVELAKIAADREIEMARIESKERQAEKDREAKLAQIEGDKEAKLATEI